MRRTVMLPGLIALAFAFSGAARSDTARTVIATGQATMQSAADSDAARRRALGEALVGAALAGGAQLVGYSAMSQARITSDLTVLRATGQVLSHRVIGARLDGQTWIIEVEAQVAPLAARQCAGGRVLALSITQPQITAPPQAPAWAAVLAETLAADLVATAAGHPRVAFDGVLARAPASSGIAAQHDYVALTRGTVAPQPGAHVLTLSLRLAPQGNALAMTTDITLSGPDGQSQRRQIVTDARLPRGEALDLVTGRTRARAEADLARGLSDTLDALLDSAGCQAPSAILARSGDGLEVPIGQRHGLSRGSLGVIEGAGPETALLEIVTLRGDRATLRPLDPSVNAAALAGARVHFVETGL
ncbi:hypothetical protein [Roseicyclus mahoneyensis]|uniref:Flagellar assembly T-like protein n=1 Tax=Roseicyclus mahoneyensis TaxID=164332 RepID=A0A316GHQ0_9RHOB|nr:hypothetical protein [Roseicyclus mahoneyensis]PWK60370.1 hypothetical protein C7455_1046 [Roseicyclus mahoneyensis]